jgi:L-aminopeptidase/D-esterase-like protein
MTSITDVAGITVGQAQHQTALTGCTVILCPDGAVAGVDVRGSAPGTRETDLLAPVNMVQTVNAIVLSGGSAYGLASAQGVMAYLREQNKGFHTAKGVVPIVPAAVLYDLALGQADSFPSAEMGYLAANTATKTVQEGNFGAGCGASCGKFLGMNHAMKSGIGTASAKYSYQPPNQPDTPPLAFTVGAIVATNAFGDVYDGEKIIAGLCDPAKGTLLNTTKVWRERNAHPDLPFGQNTTIAVVATDIPLNKVACQKIAQMSQNALARAIRPAHTMFDGDTVFALSTRPADVASVDPFLLSLVGTFATDVLIQAIMQSVLTAQPAGNLPSATSLKTNHHP